MPKTARVQTVKDYLYDCDRVKKLLMDNLLKARDKMKAFEDGHRTERDFQVGDRLCS